MRGTLLLVAIGVTSRVHSEPVNTPMYSAKTGEEPAQHDVVVRAARPKRDIMEFKLTAEQGRSAPGASSDPGKAIENMPGLARSSFGSDQLILWGAAPKESSVLFDDVEIPRLFHGSGIRSTVDGQLLRTISLTPGAFGADHGRAIGGLVRLESRDLAIDRWHAAAELSTIDGAASTSAPLSRRLAVMIGGRYGWLDRTIRIAHNASSDALYSVPKYYDGFGKLEWHATEQETVELTALGSTDALAVSPSNSEFESTRSSQSRQGFWRIISRYRRRLRDGSSITIAPWFGADADQRYESFGRRPAVFNAQQHRLGLRGEQREQLNPNVSLELGIDVAHSSTTFDRSGSLMIPAREGDATVFGRPPGTDTSVDSWSVNDLNAAPYAASDLVLGPVTISPGIRLDTYLLETSRQTPRVGQTPSIGKSTLYGRLQPRTSARWQMTRRVTLVSSLGIYSQAPAPEDRSAVFGNPDLHPSMAVHATLGERIDLTKTWQVEATGFYRSMSDLVARDPSPTPLLARALVQTGTGRALGLQISTRMRPSHGFSGILICMLSRSERVFGERQRRFDYDEPLLVTLVVNKAVGNWTFGLRARAVSGAPRTPVVGDLFDTSSMSYQPRLGDQNSIRLPTFFQLDARVERAFVIGDTRLVTYAEVLNLTNRQNGEEYAYSADYRQRGLVTGLPAVAVLGTRMEL